MNYNERGSGPKLLLVHGLGGSWQSWTTILDRLAPHRTVIAIDLPGHGATAAEPDSGTFDGLVASVQRYIAEHGLEGIDVVGSSMGARIVLELARRGGVGNVVALDPGGFWRGWERSFFKTTLGLSGSLVRAIRPGLPALSRNPVTRTALLAQLSARPWALDPELVATELAGLSTTRTFDALVQDLSDGPEQTGLLLRPTAGSSSVGAGRIACACHARRHAPRPPFLPPNCTGSNQAGIFLRGTCPRRPLRSSLPQPADRYRPHDAIVTRRPRQSMVRAAGIEPALLSEPDFEWAETTLRV